MKKQKVPVFMYHSVGIPNNNWKWNFLTTPYQDFEQQLKYLKKNDFSTIDLEQLYNHIHNDIPIPKKSIVLTFDDGYLDNYIFAYPLLKKYGFKGIIFINPEFIDPRKIVRKRFDENPKINSRDSIGFLSWEEMKIMEANNVMDIQSHAMTHTWYPKSEEIIDFRNPDDNYWWMTWNENEAKKPFLQIDDLSLVELGTPVYSHEKSLMVHRFFPNKNLKSHLLKFVELNGQEKFFNKSNYKTILFDEVRKFYERTNQEKGFFETEDQRLGRIKNELFESKLIIEKNLDKKVEFLCWPGGSGTAEGQRIAESLGYKMTTAARDIRSKTRKLIKNDGKVFSNRIGRTSPVIFQSIKKGNIKIIYARDIGMGLRIKAFNAEGITRIIYASLIHVYGLFLNYMSHFKNE